MTSPGIVIFEGNSFNFKNCQFYSLSHYEIENFKNFHFSLMPKEFSSQMARFNYISNWALSLGKVPSLIGIEDYSMGSKGKVFHIAENTGILKFKLFNLGKEPILIPPKVIKKSATGSGNATKDQMVEQFLKETGLDLKEILQPKRKLGSPTTDLVDAYFIAKYVYNNSSLPLLRAGYNL